MRLITLAQKQAKAELAAKYLKAFKQKTLPTQDVVAMDDEGRPIESHDLLTYSEEQVRRLDGQVNPASLPHHVMNPRPNSYPMCEYECALRYQGLWLERDFGRALGLSVDRFCVGPWVYKLGDVPSTHGVTYHGGHPRSSKGYWEEGVVPTVCRRRCEYRRAFGRRAFCSGTMEKAGFWSQYADIGVMYSGSADGALGYFTNVVCICEDEAFQYQGIGDSRRDGSFKVLTLLFECRTEDELLQKGRKISPYSAGDFELRLPKFRRRAGGL